MAITIVATPGDASANSYGTLAEADAFFEARIGSVIWNDEADVELKKAAMVTATQRIEPWPYRGSRATSGQALAFPRIDIYRAGHLLESDDNPTFVKWAQFEEAIALLEASAANTTDPQAPSGTELLKSLAAGSVRLEWRDPDVVGERRADDPAQALSPAAYRLLKDYFMPTGVRTDGVRPIRLTR